MNPFQNFINTITQPARNIGQGISTAVNQFENGPIPQLLQGNFQTAGQKIAQNAQQMYGTKQGQIQMLKNIAGGTIGSEGMGGDNMGGLVDKNGNPLFKPNTIYSKGQPVKLNPEAQASLESPTAEGLPPIPQTTKPNLPPLGSAEDPLAQIEEQERSEQGFTPSTPKSPGERTFPTGHTSPDDLLTNSKRNIQIDGKDVKTPSDVAQINSTLNGYGIKGSLTDQLQMTNNTIATLSNKAKNIVATEGGTISKADLVNDTARNLAYGAGHNLPAAQAKTAAEQYIDKVYGKAAGVDPTSLEGWVAPNQIPGSVLQDMKTIMNQDAQSTFEQADPTKWTQDQLISRYARDAADNILDSQYPAASKLNNDMSDLYKAQDSLRKGANMESTASQKAANLPPKPGLLQNAVNNVKEHPVRSTLEGGALAYGLGKVGLPVAQGAVALAHNAMSDFNKSQTNYAQEKGQPNPGSNQGNESSSNVVDISSLPHSMDDVKLNQNGDYTPTDPSNVKGLNVISEQEYNNRLAQLNQQKAQDSYRGPKVLAMDQAAIDSLNSIHDSSKSIYGNADNPVAGTYFAAQRASTLGIDAHKFLSSSGNDTKLLNLFRDGDLANATDPKYSRLVTELKLLEQLDGLPQGSLFKAQTLDVAKQQISLAEQNAAMAYYNNISTFVGGSGGSNMPQATQYTSPGGLPPTPPALGGVSTGVSGGLPTPPQVNVNANWQPAGQSFEGGSP